MCIYGYIDTYKNPGGSVLTRHYYYNRWGWGREKGNANRANRIYSGTPFMLYLPDYQPAMIHHCTILGNCQLWAIVSFTAACPCKTVR